jgi:hypothetical protein
MKTPKRVFYSNRNNQERVIKDTSYTPFLGKTLKGEIAIPLKEQDRVFCCCENIRGLERRNFKQLEQSLRIVNICESTIYTLKLSFTRFRLVKTLEPEKTKFLLFLFRTCMKPEGQADYKDAMDEIASYSVRSATRRLEAFKRKRLVAHLDSFDEMYYQLLVTPVEDWIPVSIFPLCEVDKESKMYLTEIDLPLQLEEYKNCITTYLHKLRIPELTVSHPDEFRKIGTSKVNDIDGPIFDHQKPKSLTCGFRYQKFMTQNLVPREVWLPDTVTKLNSSFFANIGNQILRNVDAYPSPFPEETWEKIKERLNGVLSFDLTGFGIQYPREYLLITLEVICDMYPDSDLDDQLRISQAILKDIKIQMDDMNFIFPKRGVGLGYYESIKTLSILAILDEYDPISLYGDQGLFSLANLREKEGGYDSVRKRLNHYGFLTKPEKFEITGTTIKWGGARMGANLPPVIPRRKYMGLFGSIMCSTHWERKRSMKSWYQLYSFTETQDLGFCIFYERVFGFEFFKADSLRSINREGVSTTAPIITGYSKVNYALMARSPTQEFESNFLTSRPYSETLDKFHEFEFQKKRISIFRKSRVVNQQLLDYVHPSIEMKDSRVHKELGASRPLWSDMRSLFFEGTISTSILSGLRRDQLNYVSQNFVLAHNPIEAKARGGYKVLTPTYFRYAANPDWKDFITLLQSSEDIYLRKVQRYDMVRTMRQFSPISDFETVLLQSGVLLPNKRIKLSLEHLKEYQDISFYPVEVQEQNKYKHEAIPQTSPEVMVTDPSFIDLIRVKLREQNRDIILTEKVKKFTLQPTYVAEEDSESEVDEDLYGNVDLDMEDLLSDSSS